MNHHHIRFILRTGFVLWLMTSSRLAADTSPFPLHERIDQLIDAAASVRRSPWRVTRSF